MFNWFAVATNHGDDKWIVTIFGTVVPSSEVNEQLTDDDLLSFMEKIGLERYQERHPISNT